MEALMNNGDRPASPTGDRQTSIGLTKREHLAALAMQGLSCSVDKMYEACPEGKVPAEFIAEQSVGLADALLAELEKTK